MSESPKPSPSPPPPPPPEPRPMMICPACDGDGYFETDAAGCGMANERCNECDGTGKH